MSKVSTFHVIDRRLILPQVRYEQPATRTRRLKKENNYDVLFSRCNVTHPSHYNKTRLLREQHAFLSSSPQHKGTGQLNETVTAEHSTRTI